MELNNDSTNDSDVSMASIAGLLSNSAIKAKLVSGEFKINNKRGRSKVWEMFGTVKYENDEEIQNIVACRNCFCVYKYNSKSTSNLVKHKCYILKNNKSGQVEQIDVDIEDKKQSVRVLTQWTIENCRPFQIVKDSGLKEFAQFLVSIGAKYGQNVNIENILPHPTTISRNIKNIYIKYMEIVKVDIERIKNIGYGLTSDIWTDNYLRTTYLSLTIHYIKDGKFVTRLLGLKSMKGESCTGQNIKSKVVSLLSEFGCELCEKATMVTDRGANMVSAFRNENHIFCINHLLHNVVEKAIKENPQIYELCNMCTRLVKYFKKSGINSTLKVSLKSCICTRWNTIYYLLDSIEKNWAEITKILQEKNELIRITNINLNYINELTNILKSFEETSKKLEGENYATLHLTIVHLHRLKKQCVVNSGDLEIIHNFKVKLNQYLDSIVLQNLTIDHKIALFLFPPANKLIQFTEDEKNEVKSKCKTMMQEYINAVPDQQEQASEHNMLNEELHSLLSGDKDLFKDFVRPTEVLNSNDRINKELEVFENTNVTFHEDFDLLQWWNLHQVQFPLLFKVSCKILSITASSSASERIFSSARQLISEKRSLIGFDPVLINQIMFLHSNMNKTDIYKDLEKNLL